MPEEIPSGRDDPAPSSRPNPRRRRFAIGAFCAAVCAAIVLLLILRRPSGRSEAGTAAQSVPVTTSAAREGDIGVYVQSLGTVTPVYSVTIMSRVQGEIMSVDYREGQLVKKGDPLIEIDPRPYEAALLQAQGQLAHDRGVLNEARIDLARYRKAYALNAIPKQQLDDQEQLVLQEVGAVTADQGAVESAQVNLAYCHITSPIDGRVGLRLVDPGNIVQANSTTALVIVAQLQPITVIFSVAEDEIPAIEQLLRGGDGHGDHEGVAMRVDAFDRSWGRKLATGSFMTLDNQVDTTTGTVRVRARFDNQDGALFPNQFVNTRLLVSTERGATLVSSQAIQRNSQGAFVYVIKPDHIATIRAVKVGTTNGNVTAVQGVRAGEQVAVNGFDKLQEGAKVIVRPATPRPELEEAGSAAAPGSGETAP